MSLKLSRISEWRAVLMAKGVKVSLWSIVRAVLSGPVPREVWRARMRTCGKCPVYDRNMRRCRRVLTGTVLGCNCHCPMLALTAAPYTKGCWGRQISDTEGWPAYQFPSRWAKFKAVIKFFLP